MVEAVVEVSRVVLRGEEVYCVALLKLKSAARKYLVPV